MLGGVSRTYLSLFNTDFSSGFYISESPFIWVFNLTLLISSVFLMLIGATTRTDNDYPISSSSFLVGIFSMIAGVGAALYTLEVTDWFAVTSNTGTQIAGLGANIGGIFGILSALYFFGSGLRRILRIRHSIGAAFALCPPIWILSLLVAKFNSFTTLVTIADNLLIVLFMMAAPVFAIGNARSMNGLARKDGRNYTIPTGLITALIGLFLTLPNFIYAALNSSPIPAASLGDMESVFIFFFSLYAFASANHLRRSIATV